MVFTLVSSTTQPFDVNGIKLESIIKIISAQSNLVHYECVVHSSQFMDCEDVNGGQISSFALSSQQSSCSMSWLHALEKSWLQRHQDQVPSCSGELSSQSASGFALQHWGCSTPVSACSIGGAVLSSLPSLV